MSFSATFTMQLDDDQFRSLCDLMGTPLDENGMFTPPAPYETWDAYHADVYAMCDQIAKLSGVDRVTYDEASGELCVYGSGDSTLWRGGIPELMRQLDAALPAPDEEG